METRSQARPARQVEAGESVPSGQRTPEEFQEAREESTPLMLSFMQQMLATQQQLVELLHRDRDGQPGERQQGREGTIPSVVSTGAQSGATGHATSTPTTPRQPDPNKPPTLTADMSLEQFDGWVLIWNDYVACLQLDRLSQPAAARFRTFLSPEMRSELLYGVGIEENTILMPGEILVKIRAYLRSKRNIAIDRVAFEERKQSDDETFDSFYIALRKIAANADLCSHCFEARMTTRLMVGINDGETRKKLLASPVFPDLKTAVEVCRSEESSKKNEQVLAKAHESRTVQKVGTSGRHEVLGKRSRSRNECPRCGRKHPRGRDQCPAANEKCLACGKKGHFGKMCRSKRRDGQQAKSVSSAVVKSTCAVSVRISAASQGSPSACPRIWVDIYNTGNSEHLGCVQATPDSAAEGTVAGKCVMKQLSINEDNLLPVKSTTIRAANNTKIGCLGYARTTFKYRGKEVTDTVYFCNGVEGILLPWYVCKKLGILPQCYPEPIESVANSEVQVRQSSVAEGDIQEVLGPIPREPTDADRERIRAALISEFADVFDSSTVLKKMNCAPMKIKIREGAIPFRINVARQIPVAWKGKVKSKLDSMVQQKVVAQVGDDEDTEWCHPLVCVPKKDTDDVRVCVDLTKLNPHVIRPLHPFPTPKEAISAIPNGCKYFSMFDARNGYWQIELDPESQHYTTFLTPWGRYRFLRAPMGLNATGDEFCRQGDSALVNLGNMQKVVDDMIEYDFDFHNHVQRVWKTLQRCRERQITLNDKKFKFAEPKVEFCGYVVASDGIRADPKKIKAIKEFPQPQNLKDLRSFFGLVNQLAQFTSDISKCAEPLRPLLSTKTAYVWLPEHQAAFEATKQAFASTEVLASFELNRSTRLHTDASRKNGLGFVLTQKHETGWRIVECGSRFLTGAESRYAMVELELLAVVWATKKCQMYLKGLPYYEVVVDHKPLVPILDEQTLADVENPRIQRLKEKLAGYVFKTMWVKGKDHVMPDALSRAPVDQPTEDDRELEVELNAITISAISAAVSDAEIADPIIDEVKAAARDDPEYNRLVEAVENGFEAKATGSCLNSFVKISSELAISDGLVMYGSRMVIPIAMKRKVLNALHASHQGFVKTKRRARQCVYWPGINADIENLVRSCDKCQEKLPSQPQESMMSDPSPRWVFEEVGADLFYYAGRHFMVYTDRLSGWPVLSTFGRSDPTTSDVIKFLRKNFADLGVPVKFRSDNGPQFSSAEFKGFLKHWGVLHETSTPHYPQSNGLAESAVKAMKALVAKTSKNGDLNADEYYQGLLEYRNCPKANGLSPAEVVMGHNLRSLVPAHHKLFAPHWRETRDKAEREFKRLQDVAKKYYNRSGRDLKPLKIGTQVRVQDYLSKRWSHIGTVVDLGKRREYYVKTPTGKVMRRNRRFIRPVLDALPPPAKQVQFADSQDAKSPAPPILRRSPRFTKPKDPAARGDG